MTTEPTAPNILIWTSPAAMAEVRGPHKIGVPREHLAAALAGLLTFHNGRRPRRLSWRIRS